MRNSDAVFSTAAAWAGALSAVAFMAAGPVHAQALADTSMSFFITSAGLGKGANLGGLAGADAQCLKLAEAAGAGGKTWRAYLSTQAASGQAAVNARDRIGSGPWHNAKGIRVAMSVADLHSANNALSKPNSLTEKGDVVKGRGDSPNQHDMLTGSQADGSAFAAGEDRTCANWTSETTGGAMLGHHDRQGVSSNIDPTSWNQAHVSSGCSQSALVGTGGNGYFYCFAADIPVGIGRPARARQERLAGFAFLRNRAFAGEETVYRLEMKAPGRVDAAVYTMDGRKLAGLVSGNRRAGVHDINWDGRDDAGAPAGRGFFMIRVTVE